jgi:mannose-6-phosphate isomerase-like protein (cupin superfamily)
MEANDDRVAAALSGSVLAPHGTSLVLAEWRDPGGGTEPPTYIAPLHAHRRDDEAWYVLEGALRFRLGDETVQAEAGGAVIAPRGTPHTYWNPSAEPARYLLVMTARIAALIEAIHQLETRDEQALDRVFEDHDSELLGWP